MATLMNQVLSVRYDTNHGSVIPCIGSSRGIDIQGRANAWFDLPLSISYLSNNQIVTVQAQPTVSQTTYLQQIDSMTIKCEFAIANAPHPDQGSVATCSVQIRTKDNQNNFVEVVAATSTVCQIQVA